MCINFDMLMVINNTQKGDKFFKIYQSKIPILNMTNEQKKECFQ